MARRHLQGAVLTDAPPTATGLGDVDGVRVLSVSSQDRVRIDELLLFESLEAVITRSTGCDRLPLAALREHGIDAYHLDGYATESVAQHTLMLLLMLLRRTPEATQRTQGREDGQPSWSRVGLQGSNLLDVTVGVVGTGRIGSHLVRVLLDLGVEVVGHDVDLDPDLEGLKGFRYVDSLQELVAGVDALTVHVPLTGSTRHLVDTRALRMMRPGSVLVNTARGDIVDQAAVAEALASGRLSGYAADVLPGEPNPPDLLRFQGSGRVVLTPHLAAYDSRALRARYETTASITRLLLDGSKDVPGRYRAEPADS